MITRLLHLAAALGALAIGVTLWAWGQPLISASGEVQLWVGSVWSSENSQQVADWYTLSHIIHGMLVVLVGRAFRPWIGYPAMLSVAVVTGVAWEIVEHTSWVIDRFRATTIYQGYVGDTVLNAVADYLFMLGGFFFATAVRTRWVLVAILVLEAAAIFIARDSLTLTTISVVYPIEAISDWQQELNPRVSPGD